MSDNGTASEHGSSKVLQLLLLLLLQNLSIPGVNSLMIPKLRVVMDMDECMIHSDLDNYFPHEEKGKLELVKAPFRDRNFGFYVRPGLRMFLKEVSSFSQMYVMTTGIHDYMVPVIKALDPENKIFVSLLAREQLEGRQNGKDLRLLGEHFDEKRTLLVDDRLYNFGYQPQNGILVKAFEDDENDTQLYDVLELLRQLKDVEDVRTVLGPMYGKYPPAATLH